jgi:hypothetical protein
MKKECIISRIEASQDGSPYVYVTFSDPNDYKPGAEKAPNPFGMNMMAFTSPEDLMNVDHKSCRLWGCTSILSKLSTRTRICVSNKHKFINEISRELLF